MSADRLTILAVDDERTQLEDLARLLRSFPSVEDVECASDGHAALMMASTERYDAIFLDVRMPDIDGLELGRVLRRFASPPQLVFVSAYDNAAVDAFELRALDYLRKPVSRRRVEEALERVGLAHRRRHRPDEMSGGEMQRVAIARALVIDPVLILADEPTGNLDTKTGDQILDLVQEANRARGCTVVLVTHDPRAAAHGGRVINFKDGTVVTAPA